MTLMLSREYEMISMQLHYGPQSLSWIISGQHSVRDAFSIGTAMESDSKRMMFECLSRFWSMSRDEIEADLAVRPVERDSHGRLHKQSVQCLRVLPP